MRNKDNKVAVTNELMNIKNFFACCRDHNWNVAKKHVNKVYHLGCDDLNQVTQTMIEGRECNILYMLPHVYKGDWKNLKKLPYIEELAKRTDLKDYKNDLSKLINETNFVYREEVNIIGPVRITDNRSDYKYNLLFVQLPYVTEDADKIVNGRSLFRASADVNKSMDWSQYDDVFKHYIVNTNFAPIQAIRSYLMTITLAAAVKYGMLEVVVPSSEYVWRLIDNDINYLPDAKNSYASVNGWQNTLGYVINSCQDINIGLMDIHIVNVDYISDTTTMFNYDCDGNAVYPAPVKFSFSRDKKSPTISDEPKTTEALADVKVTVNKDTLDETIDKAAKKENLD